MKAIKLFFTTNLIFGKNVRPKTFIAKGTPLFDDDTSAFKQAQSPPDMSRKHLPRDEEITRFAVEKSQEDYWQKQPMAKIQAPKNSEQRLLHRSQRRLDLLPDAARKHRWESRHDNRSRSTAHGPEPMADP
ncbi:MAG TPA: hypothetical protein VK708_05085 [Bryobacteraceae bacterium]|nr:hypothetical protein [Bryobacteraceae bacterium]